MRKQHNNTRHNKSTRKTIQLFLKLENKKTEKLYSQPSPHNSKFQRFEIIDGKRKNTGK